MSASHTSANPSAHQEGNDEQGRLTSSVVSGNTVAGVPFMPVYAPPVGHVYGQQLQFPPPLPPMSYNQYTNASGMPKPDYPQFPPTPPPPSIYYSRYPSPNYYPTLPQNVLPTTTPQLHQAGNPGPAGMLSGYNYGEVYTVEFSEEQTRSTFVKNVLTLVLVQLVVSTAMSAVCLEQKTIRERIVERNRWVVWIDLLVLIGILVYSRLRFEMARKWPTEFYMFIVWSIGVVMLLSWTTALLELEFLLILQVLLTVTLASLIFGSAFQGTPLLTGRTVLFAGVALLVSGIALGAVYTSKVGAVFFGIFLCMLFMVYVLFRLHFLMGDEWKKLQPTEIRVAALRLLF